MGNVVWIILVLFGSAILVPGREIIDYEMVRNWATRFGNELNDLSKLVIHRESLVHSFRDTKVATRNGTLLVKEMAKKLTEMAALKETAVKRIVEEAEKIAVPHQNEVVSHLQYYKMTTEIEMPLKPSKRFYGTPVDACHSAVFVPVNVNDNDTVILNPIKWSMGLDTVFLENYVRDPSLSWQYFGSSTGFIRQFPAMRWRHEIPDLYDVRIRPWYIQAANSPKDIIILVDNSGSMDGSRKEIARHVVNNILDTLCDNDFVNVFNVTYFMEAVVPCFSNNTLVQANLLNVLTLKHGMKRLEPKGLADLTDVLPAAFKLLKEYREKRKGACCNQAIMLVTDGLGYNYKEIFEEYNWKEYPTIPVRMFTFLVGEEIPDREDVKWMACNNKGYFVQVSHISEAREQVLKYVPVMARPMVLAKDEHPVNWSPMYADLEDINVNATRKRWRDKENERQAELYYSRYKNQSTWPARKLNRWPVYVYEGEADISSKYRFITSVSMPVYDRRDIGNISFCILEDKYSWREETKEMRIANLLGVAGVDIPLEEIEKHFMSHKTGVNGYAFLMTNNGFVLSHPNLRMTFYGILKPNYNSADLVELEMIDDDRGPRNISPELIELRDAIVSRNGSGMKSFMVKQHFDGMNRVFILDRHYFYTSINGTPFSVVVSVPTTYGQTRAVEPKLNLSQERVDMQYFRGNWSVHPQWKYCYYYYDNDFSFDTPEAQFEHFLKRMQESDWLWSVPTLYKSETGGKVQPNIYSYFCDKELVLSVIYQAKITKWFVDSFSNPRGDWVENRERFNVTLAFLSTHSGFTRWVYFDENEREYTKNFNKAIDEVWYRRAVEFFEEFENSFVYSVPYIFDEEKDYMVTVSQAAFINHRGLNYPVGVTGYRFPVSALESLFKNITYLCPVGTDCFGETCKTEGLDCYILDDNGYIIVSEDIEENGQFFGEINGYVMRAMIKEHIFRTVPIYDYQGICFRDDTTDNEKNFASYLLPPFYYLKWFFIKFFWIIFDPWFIPHVNAGCDYNDSEYYKPPKKYKISPYYKSLKIQRTHPELCDTQIDLFSLTNDSAPYSRRSEEFERPYLVQRIAHSNLLMVIVHNTAPEDKKLSCTVPVETPEHECPLDDIVCNDTLVCYKVNIFNFSRVGLSSCINEHKDEINITEQCGRSTPMKTSCTTVLISLIIIIKIFCYSEHLC